MNGFDAFVTVLVVIGAYRGYKSGFLMEVISLLAIVLGLLAGFKLVHIGVDYLKQKTELDESVLPYVAFALIFLIVVVLVLWSGKWMKGSFEKTLFGSMDQALGAIVGIVKIIFMTGAVLWIVTAFTPSKPEWIENSLFYPHIVKIVSYMASSMSRLFPAFKDVL